jgi:hypothetical protein
MKTYYSKNRIIGLLLFANLAFGLALFARESRSGDLWNALFPAQKTEKAKTDRPTPRAAEFREATLKNDSAIQACYDGFLARGPAVSEGAVVMHWKITDDGRIDLLKLIKSDMDDPSFLDCLSHVVRNTRMPASDPRAGRLISHTFRFRQKTPAKMEFE